MRPGYEQSARLALEMAQFYQSEITLLHVLSKDLNVSMTLRALQNGAGRNCKNLYRMKLYSGHMLMPRSRWEELSTTS